MGKIRRIRREETYVVRNDAYEVRMTVTDLYFTGCFTVKVRDLKEGGSHEKTEKGYFPLGRLYGFTDEFPEPFISVHTKNLDLSFSTWGSLHHLVLEFRNYDRGMTLSSEFYLSEGTENLKSSEKPDLTSLPVEKNIVFTEAEGEMDYGGMLVTFEKENSQAELFWVRDVRKKQ